MKLRFQIPSASSTQIMGQFIIRFDINPYVASGIAFWRPSSNPHLANDCNIIEIGVLVLPSIFILELGNTSKFQWGGPSNVYLPWSLFYMVTSSSAVQQLFHPCKRTCFGLLFDTCCIWHLPAEKPETQLCVETHSSQKIPSEKRRRNRNLNQGEFTDPGWTSKDFLVNMSVQTGS